MSRRKQSNPKPFKSDEEWSNPETRITDRDREERSPLHAALDQSSADPRFCMSEKTEGGSEDISKRSIPEDLTISHDRRQFADSEAHTAASSTSERMKQEVISVSASPSLSTHNGPQQISLPLSENFGNLISADVETARQQLTTMIQGLPFLSMIPALQHLAPAANIPSVSTSTGQNGITCVCGIRFCNTSNLEAHRMFYCSHRPSATATEDSSEEQESSNMSESHIESTEECSTHKILRCPHCPYTTQHKLSLNGHMNMHTSPEESTPLSQSKVLLHVDARNSDRYCSDCDIQFSSIKTYRVHKAHYCETRHVLKGGLKSPVREEMQHPTTSAIANLTSSAAVRAQPVLALPTTPVLLVPYSLIVGAQLLPPQVLSQPGAAFVLPNGQIQPLSSAPVNPLSTSTTFSSVLSTRNHQSSEDTSAAVSTPHVSPRTRQEKGLSISPRCELSKEDNLKRKNDGESPLDLTTKKQKITIKVEPNSDDEKENREIIKIRPKGKCSTPTGEFEGKLLSSPPRPASSDIDQDPGLPSPKHVNSNLLSPHALEHTTALGSQKKSPVHNTITGNVSKSGNIKLSTGFPSIMNSFEGVGGFSLPALPAISPEMALKLISPELLMNGIPPAVNPPVLVKQGEAKCNECNIVFYKEESLQVHKKHYCASRDLTKNGEETGDSGEKTSPVSHSGETSSSVSAHLQSDGNGTKVSSSKENSKNSKPLLQFICTACGIKYTSPDNLTAHQTYYCPKRESLVSEECISKGLWRCPRCRVAMPETLQAAHQCVTPSSSPSQGWKCPCCPVLSPTAAAAQKHLETHAGIKAFRCTICGYRGNTLRGMRTHIRMHFEKRSSDLQEENFIACILEESDHRSRGGPATDSNLASDSSRVLLENPALSLLLADGNGIDRVDPPLTCNLCSYVTPMKSVFLRHIALIHKVILDEKIYDLKALLESAARTEPDESEQRDAVEGDSKKSSPLPRKIETNSGSKETLNVGESSTCKISSTLSLETTDESHGPKVNGGINEIDPDEEKPYCQICNIAFSYIDSYIAHKRLYCKSSESRTPPETTVQ